MAIEIEIKDIANANINYSKKTLIPPFKFTLVKNLHRDNRRVLDGTVLQSCQPKKTCAVPKSDAVLRQDDSHVETLIPVRIQSLFHNAGCMSLLSVHSDNGERIGKSEDISFGKSIRSDNCSDTMIRLIDGKYALEGYSPVIRILLLRLGEERMVSDKVGDRVQDVETHGVEEAIGLQAPLAWGCNRRLAILRALVGAAACRGVAGVPCGRCQLEKRIEWVGFGREGQLNGTASYLVNSRHNDVAPVTNVPFHTGK